MSAPALPARYELKLLITPAERVRLLEQAGGLLRPDPHAGEGGQYRVTSQYLDTPDLAAARSKVDGVNRRAKVRVRFYGEVDPSTSLVERVGFVEIKRRRKDQVYKERVALAPGGLPALLADARALAALEAWVAPAEAARAGPTLTALSRLALVGIGPSCTISYRREALLGVQDPGLRVSIDQGVRAHAPLAWAEVSAERGVLVLPEGTLVLELKFAERIPRWLRDLVAQGGLRVRRVSKYAEGILARQRLAREPRTRAT